MNSIETKLRLARTIIADDVLTIFSVITVFNHLIQNSAGTLTHGNPNSCARLMVERSFPVDHAAEPCVTQIGAAPWSHNRPQPRTNIDPFVSGN